MIVNSIMAKSSKQPGKGKDDGARRFLRLPINALYPIDLILETEDRFIEVRKLNEIAELLWLPETLEENDRNARVIRAIDLFEELKPADGAESMLAAQMVGTHFAAMDCLRRAALPNQTFEGRDVNLKHAQKLMALYARQLETLNKNRGKGQQKVTVEHVHVAPGGQAIVGNVETGAGAKESTASRQIPDNPGTPLPSIDEQPGEKVTRKGRTS